MGKRGRGKSNKGFCCLSFFLANGEDTHKSDIQSRLPLSFPMVPEIP